MDQEKLEAVLGRPEHKWKASTEHLVGKNVLITGGEGSVGQGLLTALKEVDCNLKLTDIIDLDVTGVDEVLNYFLRFRPDYVFHLAGFKHAPAGESRAVEVVNININGTANVLFAAKATQANVVLASTCKAIEPETVYGSTKLIAERMTLHEGQSVARFFNVVETSGNVFEIWNDAIGMLRMEPSVMECYRYFVSLNEACQLLIYSSYNKGRFGLQSKQRYMPEVAEAYFGNKRAMVIPRRHGDRETEPFIGHSEKGILVQGTPIVKVVNYHD